MGAPVLFARLGGAFRRLPAMKPAFKKSRKIAQILQYQELTRFGFRGLKRWCR